MLYTFDTTFQCTIFVLFFWRVYVSVADDYFAYLGSNQVIESNQYGLLTK